MTEILDILEKLNFSRLLLSALVIALAVILWRGWLAGVRWWRGRVGGGVRRGGADAVDGGTPRVAARAGLW